MRLLAFIGLGISGLLVSSLALGAQPVLVQDEDGKILYRGSYEWLSHRRVVVPLSAYERLGFTVHRDFVKGTVQIVPPKMKTGFTFSVNQSEVSAPRGSIGGRDLVKYERPALKIFKREFYVAPMALKNYFPELVSTTWNSANHSVILQRTHEMNHRLSFMR